MYLPDTGLKLDAGGSSRAAPTQLGGQSYALYSASNMAKSTMMSGQLSGLGSNGATGPNQLALISLGVVLFVLGGGVLLFGGRACAAVRHLPVPGGRLAVDTEQERLELVVRLAALDERFAAGEVAETDYEAERDRGKAAAARADARSRATSPTPTPCERAQRSRPDRTLPGPALLGPGAARRRPDRRAGERLLLLGPNGAGKSTFIRVFAGLMRAGERRGARARPKPGAVRATW